MEKIVEDVIMEYIRKKRWANYSNPKCKEYLRNDFSHECAYCKLQEQEVGIVGLDFFEIDHFKPQSLNLPDMHKYHNLYYSCEKCNNEKSNIWNEKLLDPCADDIFSGNTPAIVGGKKENGYKYIAQNDEGLFYINTFKLNSRTQIRFRKARDNHENNLHQINTLIDEILSKFQCHKDLQNLKGLIFQLDNLRQLKQKELEKLPKDEMFEKAEKHLNDKCIENSLVFEEYNMDIKMKLNGITYYCELLVDKSTEVKTEYRKNISVEKLVTWLEKLNYNFGVLFYYPRINRMYFYPISNNMTLSEIKDSKKVIQIKFDTQCLL